MKRIYIYLLCSITSLLILFVGFLFYTRNILHYNIDNDLYSIRDAISKHTEYEDVIIQRTLELKNRRYVFFTVNKSDYAALAYLVKGINGKYKIKSVGLSQKPICKWFSDRIDNKTYLIIYGIDPNKIISRLTIFTGYNELKANINNQKFFLTSIEIPIDEKGTIYTDKFKFYDKSGEDITNIVLRK